MIEIGVDNKVRTSEYLLEIVSEEAGEVTQAVSKLLRFGKENRCNPLSSNNEDKLLIEVYQLQGMIEHLQELGILRKPSEDEIKNIKETKINNVYKYMDESIESGIINDY